MEITEDEILMEMDKVFFAPYSNLSRVTNDNIGQQTVTIYFFLIIRVIRKRVMSSQLFVLVYITLLIQIRKLQKKSFKHILKIMIINFVLSACAFHPRVRTLSFHQDPRRCCDVTLPSIRTMMTSQASWHTHVITSES